MHVRVHVSSVSNLGGEVYAMYECMLDSSAATGKFTAAWLGMAQLP